MDRCRACMAFLESKNTVTFEGCGHKFHKRCLGDNEKCPDGICRLHRVALIMEGEVDKNSNNIIAPELTQFGKVVTQPDYAAGKAANSR